MGGLIAAGWTGKGLGGGLLNCVGHGLSEQQLVESSPGSSFLGWCYHNYVGVIVKTVGQTNQPSMKPHYINN